MEITIETKRKESVTIAPEEALRIAQAVLRERFDLPEGGALVVRDGVLMQLQEGLGADRAETVRAARGLDEAVVQVLTELGRPARPARFAPR